MNQPPAGEGVTYGLDVVSAKKARLGNMGGATEIEGDEMVQIEFWTEEVRRILQAVAGMERMKKAPSSKLLLALDAADHALGISGRPSQSLLITVPLSKTN